MNPATVTTAQKAPKKRPGILLKSRNCNDVTYPNDELQTVSETGSVNRNFQVHSQRMFFIDDSQIFVLFFIYLTERNGFTSCPLVTYINFRGAGFKVGIKCLPPFMFPLQHIAFIIKSVN